MTILWTLLRNSLPLQLIGLALIGWGALSANNAIQRSKGASAAIEKVERKANEDAKTADAVRDAVASGKRGVRDPNKRD